MRPQTLQLKIQCLLNNKINNFLYSVAEYVLIIVARTKERERRVRVNLKLLRRISWPGLECL